jgi:hypothetical protein
LTETVIAVNTIPPNGTTLGLIPRVEHCYSQVFLYYVHKPQTNHDPSFLFDARLQRIQSLLKVLAVIVVWRLLVKRVPMASALWNLVLGWVQFLFNKIPMLARSS